MVRIFKKLSIDFVLLYSADNLAGMYYNKYIDFFPHKFLHVISKEIPWCGREAVQVACPANQGHSYIQVFWFFFDCACGTWKFLLQG